MAHPDQQLNLKPCPDTADPSVPEAATKALLALGRLLGCQAAREVLAATQAEETSPHDD